MCYEPQTSRVAAAVSAQPLAVAGGTRGLWRGRWEGAPIWSAAWTAAATSCAGSASMTMFRRSSTPRATRRARRGASCGSAAMSALLVEVVVHRGAVHADGLCGLGDGVLPLAVRPDSFIHAVHLGHKGLVVREGQCRTQNDRREYVCAVNDPAGKHGRRDEHLAERCHVVLSVSPRLSAGITPICWKSSR